MKRSFRELLTLTVLLVAVGLLLYRESTGLAFLPLLGVALNYWFIRRGYGEIGKAKE